MSTAPGTPLFPYTTLFRSSPMLFVNDKTGDSVQPSFTIFRNEASILLGMINTGKFLPWPVLAPSYRFPLCINKDPVGTSFLYELCLLPMVSYRSLGPGPRLLVLRQRVG